MIEKQAVLDALEKERKVLLQRGQIGAEHVLVHHAIQVVEKLPEEVEIVKCVDCVHFTGGKRTCDHVPFWFCADGRKKNE